MTATATRCTEKQQAFITRLLSERDVPEPTRKSIGDPSSLTTRAASKVIDYLMNRPEVRNLAAVTEEGSYRKDGVIYRVRRSRQSGNLYAQRLDEERKEFVYEPGLIKNLLDSDRMTVEEAKAFGVQFGICCVCAKLLTDPKSIAEGIGPVCGKRV